MGGTMPIPRDEPRSRRIIIPAPAAGANHSITPDDSGTWLIRSFVATLTTSAVVATRVPSLRLDDQTDVYAIFPAVSGQAATTVFTYCAYPGCSLVNTSGLLKPVGFPTDGVILRQGHRLVTFTEAIDAGDQWSAAVLDIVSYPTRPPDHYLPLTAAYRESEGL